MAKPGRNDPCPCGSGNKYKKCCLAKEEAVAREQLVKAQARDTLRRDQRAAADRLQVTELTAAVAARLARAEEEDAYEDALDIASNAVVTWFALPSLTRPRRLHATCSAASPTCTTAGIASEWCTRRAATAGRLPTVTAR
jgi:hypothetical protein